MQFSTIALPVFAIMASFAAAAPSAEDSNPGWIDGPAPPAGYEKRSDERLDALTRRGFGCPFDKYQCNDHVSEMSYNMDSGQEWRKMLMKWASAEDSEVDVLVDTVVVRDGFTCKWNS
jgi:hypothetical protein